MDDSALDCLEGHAGLVLNRASGIDTDVVKPDPAPNDSCRSNGVVYLYTRTNGKVESVNVDEAVLSTNPDDNHEIYGDQAGVKAILNNDTMAVNTNIRTFVETLQRRMPASKQ